MSFPMVVDCPQGHGGDPVPALHCGLANVAVKTLVDSWAERDHRYFRLLGDATCIARHDLPSALWALALYDREREPAG